MKNWILSEKITQTNDNCGKINLGGKMNSFDIEETVAIFKEESKSILTDFVHQLSTYEKNKDIEIITKLMRDAHSIKGSAGIVGLTDVQKLAHSAEDLLAEIKNEQLSDQKIADNIAEIKIIVAEITKSIKSLDENGSFEDKINEILKYIPSLKTDKVTAFPLLKLTNSLTQDNPEIDEILKICAKIFEKIQNCEKTDNNLINTLSATFKIIKKVVCDGSKSEDLFFLKQRISIAEQMINVQSPARPYPQKTKNNITDILKTLGQGSIRTLRIESDKLDKLFVNVGNLCNMTGKAHKNFENLSELTTKFSSKMFELEKSLNDLKTLANSETGSKNLIQKLTKEIQKNQQNLSEIQQMFCDYEKINAEESEMFSKVEKYLSNVTKTVQGVRMLPIGVILHMYPRMVRDIAQNEQKEVDIEITGAEVSVDKQILDEIKTPIIHLLRNSVDHGTELPEEREQKGKPRAGLISVAAKKSGQTLTISVKDDGCGINFEKIKQKAIADNFLTKEEAQTANKSDLLNLILQAGFTTQDHVTEISGRGMGLDIVDSKIKELGGNIKINTEQGSGTEILLEIPLNTSTCTINPQEKHHEKTKKVVVIDDSQTTKMYFSKILQNAGYNTLAFNNPIEGLKEIQQNGCDLLISDIEMPEMNGVELISQLRQNEKFKNLPIITISMLPIEETQKMFGDIFVDFMLNKSDFNEQKLLDKVKSLIG